MPEETSSKQKVFPNFEDAHLIKKNIIPIVLSSILDEAIFYPFDTIITHQQDTALPANRIIKQLWRE